MTTQATEAQNTVINQMQRKIHGVIRFNRNLGHAALVAIIIDNYHECALTKQQFMQYMQESWDFYEQQNKPPVEAHLHKRELVEALFNHNEATKYETNL